MRCQIVVILDPHPKESLASVNHHSVDYYDQDHAYDQNRSGFDDLGQV